MKDPGPASLVACSSHFRSNDTVGKLRRKSSLSTASIFLFFSIMLLNGAFLVSLFAASAVGQISVGTSSSGLVTSSSTKHAKHSAVRSITHFPNNATTKASTHVATVTETVALSLVLDILDISVRIESSSHSEKSSKARHSSQHKSSSKTLHGCSVTTIPQVCCGGPGVTTMATVTPTVSQGFNLGITSTTSSSSGPNPSIISATSSSG